MTKREPGVWTPAAIRVLEERYLMRDDGGKIVETPYQLCNRVATAVAKAEANYPTQAAQENVWAKKFRSLLLNHEFLPNSPTLMNAGKGNDLQLSACYVVPVDDSLEGIFTAVKHAAIIHQSGGGTGFSFSRLRPRGAMVKSTRGVASGPVSFMHVFDAATESIKQGGCWAGETLIATVKGNIPIKDLVDTPTWVYAWDKSSQRVTVKRTTGSWKTKTAVDVYELKTEKGVTVRATPDHPIMLRTGEYRRLEDLSPGTPLMPLRRYKKSAGDQDCQIRPHLYGEEAYSEPEYRFVYEEVNGPISNGLVIHHKNGDHNDNSPSNMVAIEQEAHASLHAREYRRKLSQPSNKNPMRTSTVGREKVSAYAQTQIAKDEKTRGRILSLAAKVLAGGYALDDWETSLKSLGLKNHQRIKKATALRLFGSFEAIDSALEETNDRVVSVTYSGKEDVYNLEVEDLHNYAVVSPTDPAGKGVFVSNTRRGANMGILRVDHPDILEFIDCKRTGKVTNFNISVAITDHFMQALSMKDGEYRLWDPQTRNWTGEWLNAKMVWDKIADAAWATGDPGLVFIDRANASSANPTPDLELLEATNPCGEQWLGAYDACNLGSINVAKFTSESTFNWGELEDRVRTAVRFLDDVIDINPYPLEEVREKVLANRRIGLGIMGWADALLKLGIRYDGEHAITLASELMHRVQAAADAASVELANERGEFPNWRDSRYYGNKHIRNSNRTTIAPTGTISILANCSSGIEPIFALAYVHRVKQPDGTYRELEFINPVFQEAVSARLKHNEAAKDYVLDYAKRHGSLHGVDAPHDELFAEFTTAHDVNPYWHIKMQAAFQMWVDNSISKTINMPNDATVEEVQAAYMQAWESGCLGITIFRDGCKGEQVLNTGVTKQEPVQDATLKDVTSVIQDTSSSPGPYSAEEVKDALTRALYAGGIKQRPAVLRGYTRKLNSPAGTLHVTLNSDDDGLLEVYLNVGKAGSDVEAMAEALGRLISLCLRMESKMTQAEKVNEVAYQLRHIGGRRSIGFGKHRVSSLPDGVAYALEVHIDDAQLRLIEHEADLTFAAELSKGTPKGGNMCSQCGNMTLVYAEGCLKCASCGYSEC